MIIAQGDLCATVLTMQLSQSRSYFSKLRKIYLSIYLSLIFVNVILID